MWILRTKKGVVVVSTGMLWLLCFLVIVAAFLLFLVSIHATAWIFLAGVSPIWCIGLYAFFEYLANGFLVLDFHERTLMRKSLIFAKRKHIIPLDQIREIHTPSKRNSDGPDLKMLSLELQSGEHIAILPDYCTDFVNIGRLQNILREEVAKTKS